MDTGRGRVVDANLVDNVFGLMEGLLSACALDRRVRHPPGAALPTASPTNTHACADGRWLCIAGSSDLIFVRLIALRRAGGHGGAMDEAPTTKRPVRDGPFHGLAGTVGGHVTVAPT